MMSNAHTPQPVPVPGRRPPPWGPQDYPINDPDEDDEEGGWDEDDRPPVH